MGFGDFMSLALVVFQSPGELILKSMIPPKRIKSRDCIRALYTKVHGSILPKSQKAETLKCPLMREQIHKTWHIPKMEHYPALKRNGIQTQATPWMNLEDMPSEQKDTYCRIPLLESA